MDPITIGGLLLFTPIALIIGGVIIIGIGSCIIALGTCCCVAETFFLCGPCMCFSACLEKQNINKKI